ncbi:hypothetical protein SAMN05421788_107167 [Filimonas lacunae]|uniref:Uncharacterized protein n=1 Tax=Filimonas lacunae TaxID=477680 RepID=A0A173MFY0_9BACT|nr:hypothetical protein [Filimonas lacunae]BAV06503.1 hypothetical protein FLA_2522 [Filimonas lacunae]SIT27198.1 hypothetical protein SAMN05421788_107167 [Filimonas lacunae]
MLKTKQLIALVAVLLLHTLPVLAQKSATIAFTDTAAAKAEAEKFVQQVEQSGKWLDQLTPSDLNELPVGLSAKVSNVTYKVAISNATFYPTYAELTVFARIEIPQNPKKIYFGVSGLKLSYEGGIVGDARLVLLGDIPIPINNGNAKVTLKGSLDMKTGKAVENLTYATIDCRGVKELGITADISFPRNILIPCDKNGAKIAGDSCVSARFTTIVSDWNDMLATVSLPDFQVNKLEDVVFKIKNATFDFSDARNSSNVVFPSGYQSKYLNGYPDVAMWRGIYASDIEVMLPKAFQKRGNTDRVLFGAKDLLIDNNGVSGNIYGKNIIPFEEGNAGGWRFSVNEFHLSLEANSLAGAGFTGNIGLPVADKDSLSYEAVITQDNQYWLTVSPKGKMDFSMWQAKVVLDSNSYVKLRVADGKFLPEANLYGNVTIEAKTKATSTKSVAQFKGVTFKGLHIQSVAPYLKVDYFGYNGTIGIAGFPASIDSIVLTANGKQANLSFGLNVTLQDNAFKASTRLNIATNFTDGNYQGWELGKVSVSRISLENIDLGGMTLSGGIELLEDDPTYGDGFGGNIKAKFKPLNAEVSVKALFGKKTFRYWYVEGSAKWAPALPIMGGLNLKGFCGGAYYRMLKTGSGSGSGNNSVTADYKPDSAMGLGIKAGIFFTVGSETVVDGMAQFEVAFGKSGGMKYIGVFGNAKIMGKLPGIAGDMVEEAQNLYKDITSAVASQLENLSDALKLDKIADLQQLAIEDKQAAAAAVPTTSEKPENSTGISAYMGMSYDFDAKTFHANFDVYVNAAKGLLQGIGNNYRAGWAVLHFAPGEWYIHMGTPTDPMGIKFGIGGFSIRTESYLMIGDHIPGSPAPPQEVADILGVELSSLDYMRDANALGEGRGFAFGAKVKIETGDISFLILYANLKAGVGFDVMLKEYPGVTCEGSNEPIGINGWYANAQAYAYLQGEIGVKVNLWFMKLRVPVVQGAVAALLQAKLPNPSWFTGYIGLQVNVLGIISGKVRFKLTLGNECKLVSNEATTSVLGTNVISNITPRDSVNVDVFAAPQVAFNFPIDKEIRLPQEGGGEQVYKVKLEQFTMTSNNTAVPGKTEWNNGMDLVSYYSNEILPSKTAMKVYVKVSFLEYKNNSWQSVYVEGKKAEEERTLNFITGDRPTTIPMTNIVYSYPVVDQRYFYKEEFNQGYIQLKRGQNYLFNVEGYNQKLIAVSDDGTQINFPFRYDSASARLLFNIYSLANTKSYSLQLNSYKLGTGVAATPTTTQTSTDLGDAGTVTVKNNTAQDVIRDDVGLELLSYNFATSAFNTFAQKMGRQPVVNTYWGKVSSDVIFLQAVVEAQEPFEEAELNGTTYTNNAPLVQPLAITSDDYFTQDIWPLNYKEYPAGGVVYLTRDTAILGLAPVKALPVTESYRKTIVAGNYTDAAVLKRLPYLYNLVSVYKDDYLDLQNQVANQYLGTPVSTKFTRFITGYFPFLRQGFYKVNYRYILPGNQAGSSSIVQYQNPIQ